ncbi:hypothetical protein Tco_0066139 [Tanacetum coccineum]
MPKWQELVTLLWRFADCDHDDPTCLSKDSIIQVPRDNVLRVRSYIGGPYEADIATYVSKCLTVQSQGLNIREQSGFASKFLEVHFRKLWSTSLDMEYGISSGKLTDKGENHSILSIDMLSALCDRLWKCTLRENVARLFVGLRLEKFNSPVQRIVQETTEKIIQVKQRMQAARDRQKSYADLKRSDGVRGWSLLDLSRRCHADETLSRSLDRLHFDDKALFVEEPYRDHRP